MPEAIQRPIHTGRQLALWTGVLGPAIVFFFQFEINYALVPWECTNGGIAWPIHIVTLVSLVLVALCGLTAWRAHAGENIPPYVTFMSWGGAGLSAMFFLAILAQGIASVVLGPCN